MHGQGAKIATAYFVTIVTKNREPLFGQIVDGEMVLNALGEIVQFAWIDLVNHNENIGLDEFIIMPNHIHGIIALFDPVGAGSKPAQAIGAGCEPDQPGYEPDQPGYEPDQEIGAGYEPAPTRNAPLSEIVRQFKTFSARRINQYRNTPGIPVWQRNYYDHIIGTDREYERIAEYIADNPSNWLTDEERKAFDW